MMFNEHNLKIKEYQEWYVISMTSKTLMFTKKVKMAEESFKFVVGEMGACSKKTPQQPRKFKISLVALLNHLFIFSILINKYIN